MASPRGSAGALALLLSAPAALRPHLLFLSPARTLGSLAQQAPAALEPHVKAVGGGPAGGCLPRGGAALFAAALGLAACRRGASLSRAPWRSVAVGGRGAAPRRVDRQVSGQPVEAPSYTTGIYVILYAKDTESAPKLLQFLKEHFVRQLDGREPGAITCTLAPPTEEEPTAVRLFELWKAPEDYDAHTASENLKRNGENIGPYMDAERTLLIKSDEVEHFARPEYVGEPRVGIAVDLKAKDEESAQKVVQFSREHFGRQLDGREPGATSAAMIPPTADEPTTIRYFEHWRTEEDYAAHQTSEHLKMHLDNISPLILEETLRIVKFSGAEQFGRSDVA